MKSWFDAGAMVSISWTLRANKLERALEPGNFCAAGCRAGPEINTFSPSASNIEGTHPGNP